MDDAYLVLKQHTRRRAALLILRTQHHACTGGKLQKDWMLA